MRQTLHPDSDLPKLAAPARRALEAAGIDRLEQLATFREADIAQYPYFAGSAESLMTAMEENARQNPDKVLEIKRVIAEGEFVAVHSHVRQKPGDLGAAVVHIFRFAGDRIVELWDVGQAVPESSPNTNGMF